MSVVKEFRDFIARGNVVDLAVGVIIGAAFGKIVTSLVEQVVMPPIGLLLGEVDFSDLKLILKPADLAAKTDEVAILYGAFINTVIQFVIVALAVFLMVKLVNKLRRNEAAEPDAAPTAPTPTELLLTEIRDSLKAVPKAPAAKK
jgi:large conductance mechanosensitive channel